MPGKKVTHSEHWWEMLAPPHVLRCTAHYKSTGERCRAEAYPGANVCTKHGALAPAVRQAAAVRLQSSVDEAAKKLIEWMNDPNVDMRERVKVAQDLLDRGGLGPTSKHLVGVVGNDDPVETLFRDLLGSPDAFIEPTAQPVKALPAPDPAQEAIDRAEDGPSWEQYLAQRDHDVVDAELVDDAGAPPQMEVRTLPPKHIREDLERLGLL